jgi:hypothetical protein
MFLGRLTVRFHGGGLHAAPHRLLAEQQLRASPEFVGGRVSLPGG